MNNPINARCRVLTAVLTLIASALGALAQANFAVLPVRAEGDISVEAAKVIFRKTEQILTRNSAGAAGAADVFAVEAKLTVTDKAQSSGLVRQINSVSGELQLVALNKVDNAKYYSVTVPLEAVVKDGGESAAVLALANSIKPTDAVFTRFVRVARDKVEEYYSDHCSEIIGRANNIGLSGQYATALIYLTGMPASAPCHEEALELIAALRAKIDSDIAAREEKEKSEKTKDDTDSDTDSDTQEKDKGDDSGSSPSSDGAKGDLADDIFVESPNWNFRLEEAAYLPTSRKIKITAFVTYIGKKSLSGDCALGFRKAIDADGESYDTCYVYGDKYRTFPDDVPVKIEFYIDNVKKNPGKLSFVGFSVDYKKIEIRNLKISE